MDFLEKLSNFAQIFLCNPDKGADLVTTIIRGTVMNGWSSMKGIKDDDGHMCTITFNTR